MKKLFMLLLTVCCFMTIQAVVKNDFKAIFDLNVPNDEIVKNRQESGTAYVDFITGKSEIVMNFRDNSRELKKIEKTINDVRNDRDISIKSIFIEGFASPEGTQNLNNQLSNQRTIALAEYIRRYTNLSPDIPINTTAGGEDWALLRSEVEYSNLKSKKEVLEIIDDPYLSQDEKDKKIQESYPSDYKWLRDNVFPKLRRSEYVVEYTVRNYSDINEIRQISKSNPHKLSLSEIYRLANTYKAGSSDFYNIMLLGAYMFPHNAIANLNAGAASLDMKNYQAAIIYLDNSGDSETSYYNRGVYYAHIGDYDKAIKCFNLAPGIKASADCIRKIKLLENNQSGASDANVNGNSNSNTGHMGFSPETQIPGYVSKSNLKLQIGYSRNFGEFAGLEYYTPSFSKEHYSKFFISSGIGKEFIFNSPYKEETTWFIGGGFTFGRIVQDRRSYSRGWFYSMAFNYGTSACYENNVFTWDAVTIGYVYNRFSFSGTLGCSWEDLGEKLDDHTGFEGKITISYRLF